MITKFRTAAVAATALLFMAPLAAANAAAPSAGAAQFGSFAKGHNGAVKEVRYRRRHLRCRTVVRRKCRWVRRGSRHRAVRVCGPVKTRICRPVRRHFR